MSSAQYCTTSCQITSDPQVALRKALLNFSSRRRPSRSDGFARPAVRSARGPRRRGVRVGGSCGAAVAGRAADAAKLAAKAEKVEERAAEKVEDLQLREAMVVAPVIEREAPKVAGIATREVWRFEVTDPALVPREYLVVDEAKIGKVVRALKGDTAIAGVRVYSERQLASSAA